MPNRYRVGQSARCTGNWWDGDYSARVDPAAVYFYVTDPSGNVDSYEYGVDDEVVKEEDGKYHVDVSCDEAGVFVYQFWSTGAYQASAGDQFEVTTSGNA